MTPRVSRCVVPVALGLLGCRIPEQTSSDGASPPTSGEAKSDMAAEQPGELDCAQVETLIETHLRAPIDLAQSLPLGLEAGAWREVIAFRINGEDYCRTVIPEAERAKCDFVPGRDGIPWSSQEFLGLAVVACTDSAAPSIEHLRVLEHGCHVWNTGTCGEDPLTPNTTPQPRASNMKRIQLDRFHVADVDGDKSVELVLVTSYVELAISTQDEWGDTPEAYSEDIYTRRRLTVLRGDLSRQLDIDVHQEMFPWTPGVEVTADLVNEAYEITPEAATVTWCEIEGRIALDVRECLNAFCASPTTRVRLPYDADKDLYAIAPFEPLRPVISDWEGCPK